ncbi:diphthamide synthesis protein [Candidatus Parvarchaeota archaeon]|nr:diphthamide synthesis protein [Candidatus Parvarchaeota archaeon]
MITVFIYVPTKSKDMDTMFVEARYRGGISEDLFKKLEAALSGYKKINLVASVQYLDQMQEFAKKIEGKELIIKRSPYRAQHPGQILGCDVYAAECEDCDVTLAFTQGMFHVLGIPIKFGKKVINVDIESGQIDVIDEKTAEHYRKSILQGIGSALVAERVMFLESTKAGQTYGVGMLKEAMKKKGKKVFSVVFDEVNFQRLNEFRDVDIFINTACQRIAIDDAKKLEKPIVNAEDLEPYFLR